MCFELTSENGVVFFLPLFGFEAAEPTYAPRTGGGSSDVLHGAVGSLHTGPVARGGHTAVPSPHVRGSRSPRTTSSTAQGMLLAISQ
jgi:hypothetical protein